MTAKRRRRHAPGRARALHERMKWRSVTVKDHRIPAHAFVADHTHLEHGVAINRGQHGDETIGWKIDMADAIALRVKITVENQVYLRAVGDETVALLGRQRGEQPIG